MATFRLTISRAAASIFGDTATHEEAARARLRMHARPLVACGLTRTAA